MFNLIFKIGVIVVYRGLSIIYVSAFVFYKVHITGQCSQIVHNIINTEIVAVNLIVGVKIKALLVQRQFTDTVDGIFRSISHICHTVLGTLQHQATAEHTAEVGSLNGVQQSAGINRTESILFPFCPFSQTFLRISGNRIILFFSNS